MFENTCTLPLSSDIFAQATQSTLPVFVVGLASGHVQAYKLPSFDSAANSDNDADESHHSQNGYGTVDEIWSTRRHKGSCRTLSFSPDGTTIYSAGGDGIVKAAVTETGRVVGKCALPIVKYGYSISKPFQGT
jgi:WD40 repeat protein